MSNTLWIKLACGAVLLSLAACGDGGNGVDPAPDPGTIQSQFGPVFEDAFNADANAEPIDPQPGDLPAVSFTDDPIDF